VGVMMDDECRQGENGRAKIEAVYLTFGDAGGNGNGTMDAMCGELREDVDGGRWYLASLM